MSLPKPNQQLTNTALEVADEFPVFPCDENKRPVCSGGFKAATQDPDEIQRLFSIKGAALIGIPTGEASGLSVIDIDVRDGKQGLEWEKGNAEILGLTKKAKTQSGGRHYYYLHPEGLRNSAGIDGCVDIRAEGGYVIHPASAGYEWLNNEEVAPFPKKFGLATPASGLNLTNPLAPLSIAQMLELRGSYEGHSWNRIVSTICYSAAEHGWSDPQIRQFLEPICDDGANDADLTPILKSMRKKVGVPDSGDTSPAPLPQAKKLPVSELGEIDLDEIKPRELVYGRHYIAGVFSLTIASGGVGKSMLVILEACDMANLGKRVLLLMLEDDTSEVKRRIMACIIHHGLDAATVGKNLIILTDEATLTIAGVEQQKPIAIDVDLLRDTIKEYTPDAVIIDPLVRTHQMNENDNGQMNFVATLFTSIARQTNTSLMLVHHARKGSDNVARGERSRGASALMDASRNVRELRPLSDKDASNLNIDDDFIQEFIAIDHTKASYTAHAQTCYMRKVAIDLPAGRFGTQNAATVEEYVPEKFEDIITDEHREHIKTMVSLARTTERPYVQKPRAGSRDIYADAASDLKIGKACVKWLVNDLIKNGDLIKSKLGRSEAALAVKGEE